MKYLAPLGREFRADFPFSFRTLARTSNNQLRPRPKGLLVAAFLGGFCSLASATPSAAQTATVDGTNVHQTIAGFGAYNAWAPNGSYDNLLFSTLGYSLLRVSLPIDDSCNSVGSSCANGVSSVSDMQACLANGCKVWATVSSPPAEMKTNNDVSCTVIGAALLPGDYAAFATYMSNYIASLQRYYNISLYAISAQNEPDTCSYETNPEAFSVMTGATLDIFIKSNLGPTLAANGQKSTLIMMPESSHFSSYTSLAGPCMADSACASYIGINAFHDYDNASSISNPYAGQFWETETSSAPGFGPTLCGGCWDPSIADAVMWSRVVHNNMVGDVSAFHYFWYVDPTGGDTNSGLINPSQPTPVSLRTYAIAQWAKFVRPGWVRVDATANPTSGVDVTAFKNPSTGDFAIVAVNENGSASPVNFALKGLTTVSVTPYLTSNTATITPQASVSLASNSFNYSLAGQSITTFVGSGSGPAAPSNLSGKVVAQ